MIPTVKLINVRHDMPDNNNKISIPIGDRLINDVLNGGYNDSNLFQY